MDIDDLGSPIGKNITFEVPLPGFGFKTVTEAVGVRRIVGVLFWPRGTAPRRSMMPAPPHWTWGCRNTGLSAAIWSAARKLH